MVFARCCRQRTISFFTLYVWWEFKLRYCPIKVCFRYTDDLNLCSVQVIDTSGKDNLSCFFSIMNCIDDRIEFTWSSNVWTSSWWSQRMNVSSMYLSHIDDFSDIDPNAISSKYSVYMLVSTGDSPSLVSTYQTLSQRWSFPHRKLISLSDYLWDTGAFLQQGICIQLIRYHC